MAPIIAFAIPELTEDLVRASVSTPEVFQRALMHSGTSMGVMGDLYYIDREHPEICGYASIVNNILQRASEVPLRLLEALGRSVQLFHEYEDKLAVMLEEVAAAQPRARQGHGVCACWYYCVAGHDARRQVREEDLDARSQRAWSGGCTEYLSRYKYATIS